MRAKNPKFQIKNVLSVMLVIYLGFVTTALAQTKTLDNIGFIKSNIWYSKEPFFAGETVRVYTAVFNASPYDVRGSVEFVANGISVGKTPFSLINGGFQVVWADWLARAGAQKVSARITGAVISLPGGTEESIELANAVTGELEQVVDVDADGDGIGNMVDKDDDNDGVADGLELAQGTDPLAPNTGVGIARKELPEQKSEVTVSTVKETVSVINEFLDVQKEKIKEKKAEVDEQIAQQRDAAQPSAETNADKLTESLVDNSEDKEKSNFPSPLQFYSWALAALIFSLEYKIVFYLIALFVAWRIFKFGFRLVFGK